jgi:predicted phosphoribosyltransferase
VVCLETPEVMFAVGEFYREFSSVTDDEVVKVLQQHRTPVKTGVRVTDIHS